MVFVLLLTPTDFYKLDGCNATKHSALYFVLSYQCTMLLALLCCCFPALPTPVLCNSLTMTCSVCSIMQMLSCKNAEPFVFVQFCFPHCSVRVWTCSLNMASHLETTELPFLGQMRASTERVGSGSSPRSATVSVPISATCTV